MSAVMSRVMIAPTPAPTSTPRSGKKAMAAHEKEMRAAHTYITSTARRCE